jgi:hypothetical protein
MKTVIIVGMIGAYTDDPKGAEIWGVNLCYKHQHNLSRLYCMDDLELLKAEDKNFIDNVNRLDIPVIYQEKVDEIPNSRAFALREAMALAPGFGFFTSTIAYMVADAIVEGFEHIIMHRINCYSTSIDYFHQKDCLDMWLGFATGRGIKISVSSDSHLLKPYSWHPGFTAIRARKTSVFIT